MKSVINLFFFVGLIAMFQACSQAPEGQQVAAEEEASVPAANETADKGAAYSIDAASSSIKWTGSKPAGKTHTGTVNISEGKLMFNGETITAGKFQMDMTSINVTDLEGSMKDKLQGHLHSDDFFNTGAHPNGSFEVVSVEKADGSDPNTTHFVKGNLTLKGITKAINIPAKVSMNGDKLMANTPAFTIDRTQWDVNYNSSIIGAAADALINDQIGLEIALVATPTPVQ